MCYNKHLRGNDKHTSYYYIFIHYNQLSNFNDSKYTLI